MVLAPFSLLNVTSQEPDRDEIMGQGSAGLTGAVAKKRW